MPKVTKAKEQEKAPAGGWLGPRTPDKNGDTGPTKVIAVAVGVDKRSGKWKWKEV